MIFNHKTLILDASCVISLYASECMADILRSIPPDITVAAYVANQEALYVRGELDKEGKRPLVSIDLQPLLEQKLLVLVDEDSEAEATIHTNLAAQIRGRGEVTTAAIAIHRGWGIVVDDKRARSLFHTEAPHIQLLHTLDLVHYWTDKVRLNNWQIETVLKRMRFRASFYPNAFDPNYEWWQEYFPHP